MARTTLVSSSGQSIQVDSEESADVVITLEDTGSALLVKSAISTIVCSLFNASDRKIINNRYFQSIYDTNGGSITDDGVVTISLQPNDNVIIGTNTQIGESQSHFLLMQWTWVDSNTGANRTGRHEFEILVRNVGGFTIPAVGSGSGSSTAAGAA